MDEHYAYLVTQIFKKNDDANLWSQSRWATMLKKTYEDENKMIDDIFDEEQCCICIEVIVEDDFSLPCNHIFHRNCIKKWIKKSKTCPLCNKIHNVNI